jgi:hypothetical protein
MLLMSVGMKMIVSSLLVLTLISLAACSDWPGADGRYAVHDHGLQHGSP